MIKPLAAIVLISAVLSSCLLTSPDDSNSSLVGTWGGEHISLDIRISDATIEYDCASGTISQPIETNGNGVFKAIGTHVIGHGGPIRDDEEPDEHPARYNGIIRGSNMTLTVTLTDTGLELDPFQLEKGKPGRLFKCL